MKSMMKKTTLREIKHSFGRWFAIFAIVALGVGFFTGLKVTKQAMLATENKYLKEQNMFDAYLISTLGFTKEDVVQIGKTEGVAKAAGGYELDVLCSSGEENEYVLKAHSLTEGINEPVLKNGRMPEKPNECVIDSGFMYGEEALGTKIYVSDNNLEDTKDMLKYREYEVVGIVDSPYYMNFERGTTSIGNGRVSGFFYLLEDTFEADYYTRILVKGDIDEKCYSDEYNDALDELKDALDESTEERVQLRFEDIKQEALEEIADGEKELEDKKAEAEKEFADAWQELEDARIELEDGEEQLNAGEEKIAAGKKELAIQKSQLEAQEQTLLEAQAQCPYEFLPEYAQIQQGLAQVEAGKQQIASAERTLESNSSELESKREELQSGRKEYEDGLKEYEDSRAEYEQEIDDAQAEIDDAKQKVADLEEPDFYVIGRNTNIGYACFESDSDIVNGIANVFPIFFFLVAALVCMTTMNRMVEEQRTQIGVLKALGYGSGKIMSKYLFYSGSAASIGGIFGFFAGSVIFPTVIWTAYGMMYRMPEIVLVFNVEYAVISLVVALICSMGTTYFTCRYELAEKAASLIRPKAAKNGKRILLERIPFLWKRLKFLHKVSIRNLIRYKKRFFMMVIGISGCTALLTTGFGIRDSIINIASEQYEEIQIYDVGVTFKESCQGERRDTFLEKVEGYLENAVFAMETTVDMEVDNKVKSVSLLSMDEAQEIENCLSLHTVKGEKISYPETGEAVITNKLSKKYDLTIGSIITLRDEDMNTMQVTVSGICENFVYNYVFISNTTYEEQMKKEVEINTAYVNILADMDVHEAAAGISDTDNVTAVSVNEDIKERFSSMMSSLNYVIILIVISAGLLAFIVLYNLTNINITERIREIATIKVLGFYPGETASYVFRENIILTAVGAFIGLVLGRFLHAFVMAHIDIDMVSFDVQILPLSYLFSFLLTLVFAEIVDGVMYFKLEKINMAESLKSVE